MFEQKYVVRQFSNKNKLQILNSCIEIFVQQWMFLFWIKPPQSSLMFNQYNITKSNNEKLNCFIIQTNSAMFCEIGN